MKTYIVHLLCRDTDTEIGSITIQAADWKAADRIANAMFPDGYIGMWYEEAVVGHAVLFESDSEEGE